VVFTATVFYEDSMDENAQEFGLHNFVVAAVADVLGITDVYRTALLPHFDGQPKNGNTRVLGEICSKFERLRCGTRHVIGLLDRDKIKDVLRPGAAFDPRSDDDAPVIRQIKDYWELADEVEIHLLRMNTESVIRGIQSADQGYATARHALFEEALTKKRRDARDRIFQNAAREDNADLRRRVVSAISSLKTVVDRLAQIHQTVNLAPAIAAAPEVPEATATPAVAATEETASAKNAPEDRQARKRPKISTSEERARSRRGKPLKKPKDEKQKGAREDEGKKKPELE